MAATVAGAAITGFIWENRTLAYLVCTVYPLSLVVKVTHLFGV